METKIRYENKVDDAPQQNITTYNQLRVLLEKLFKPCSHHTKRQDNGQKAFPTGENGYEQKINKGKGLLARLRSIDLIGSTFQWAG